MCKQRVFREWLRAGIVAFATLGAAALSQAQPNWALQAPANHPVALLAPQMAYDALHQKVLLFSGTTASGGVADTPNDTWLWDGQQRNWMQVNPLHKPAGRVTAGMAYDTARQQIVMFGGGVGNTTFGDTWVWDGSDWTQKFPANSPPARQGFSMAYDAARQQVVLFGGLSAASAILGDTWTWDGNTWTQQHPTASPSARLYHQMAYDEVRQETVLFGGGDFAGTDTISTTWVWNGSNWIARTPAAFPPGANPVGNTFQFHSMVFDSALQQIVLFGGYNGGPQSATWLWDGTNWTQFAGTGPGARYDTGMAYDSTNQQVVLFGGDFPTSLGFYTFETWLFNSAQLQYLLTATSVPANGGVAQASPPGPTDPYYDANSAVIVQATPNAGYDFLYWSGACSGSNPQCLVVMSGPRTVTANFAPSFKWIPLFPATTPPARRGASVAYDQERQQVVLFGGDAGGSASYNDTWVWDGVNWTQKHPAHSPPAGTDLAMAYDAVRMKTVLLGGVDSGSSLPVASQTWVWDGTDWTQMFPKTSPNLRYATGMAFDAVRQRVVLFGGQYHSLTFLQDTWTWDGTDWTQQAPAHSPPARTWQGMTYDEARQQVVTFGGIGSDAMGNPLGYLSDTWTWNGTDWSQKSPVTIPAISSYAHGMAYDGLTQQVILPAEAPIPGQSSVTWFWDGVNWAQKLRPVSPPAQSDAAVAYDAARQQLVLFGQNPTGGNGTWIYANNSNPPQYMLTTTASPAGTGSVAQSAPGQPGPTYYLGTTVTVTATPAAGYGLQSWSGACSGSGACVVTMDAAKNVTANFTSGPLNVTINVPPTVQFAINGNTYTGTQTIALTPGTYPLTMATPQSAGAGTQLAFQVWSDGSHAANRSVVVDRPVSLTATFQTQYLLTTAVSPAGQGSISPGSAYRVAGAVIPVTATANPGYSFVNWSGACSGGGACSVTMNAPQTVTANFAPGAFPVQITVPAGRTFTLNGVGYTTSANVLLAPGSYPLATTAAQSTGAGVQAAFVSWSDGGALSHSITVVGVPISITGTFKTQYLLAASAAPANEGSLALTSVVGVGPFYDPGTVVLVTATAQPGYQFQSWAGACSGASPACFVTVSAPAAVTANFGVPQTWVQLFPAMSPSARHDVAMTWDLARQQAVLFGGLGASGSADTWTFDGFNWTLQNPANAPSPRGGHAMAFDAGASRVVLFGGLSEQNLSDTWLWDGFNWTLKAPGNHPSPRAGHAMAYDAARGKTVLFGGNCTEPPLGGCIDTAGDTWVWDGTNWTPKSPAHSPSARTEHSMIYDSANQVVLLFGGRDANGNWLGDTWVWNGTDWSQKNPITAPPARVGAALAYDPTRQIAILFGGSGVNGPLNDTWIWDGVNWQARVPSLSPAARTSAAIAFDPVHAQPVLFGGADTGGASLNDTWVWLTPIINVVPQTPALARDARGNYQVQITIKNQSNVPLTSISLTSIKLGGVSLASYIGATTRTNVLPGGTTSFIAVFPIASVPGATASLSFQGVYTAASVVNAPWSGSVRSVVLP